MLSSMQRELGPASKRGISIQYASPYTPLFDASSKPYIQVHAHVTDLNNVSCSSMHLNAMRS